MSEHRVPDWKGLCVTGHRVAPVRWNDASTIPVNRGSVLAETEGLDQRMRLTPTSHSGLRRNY